MSKIPSLPLRSERVIKRHAEQHQHQQQEPAAGAPRSSHCCDSLPGTSHEHVRKDAELFEALAAPESDRVQRVVGNHYRHARLSRQPGIQAMQQGAPSGEDDALFHDVGGQLGRRLVERHLDRVDDGRDRLFDRLTDLFGSGDDRLGQAGDEVPAPDFGAHLVLERAGRTQGDLDLLGGALARAPGCTPFL